MKNLFVAIISLSFLFFACNKDDAKELTEAEQLEKDIELIEEYLIEKNLAAIKTEYGLYYIIEETGTGSNPGLDSIVSVEYTGTLLDGTLFSKGIVSDKKLTAFIQGWQIGLPYFKEGGKGKLIIPSKLGYGNNAVGNIPKNSVLIFDVELLKVKGQ